MRFQPGGNFTIDGSLNRGLSIAIEGDGVFPSHLESFALDKNPAKRYTGSVLATSQNGSAHYFGSPEKGTSSGYGRTAQVFSFEGLGGENGAGKEELYYRDVEAVNGTVVRDRERVVGRESKDLERDEASVGTMDLDDMILAGRGRLWEEEAEKQSLLVQGSDQI